MGDYDLYIGIHADDSNFVSAMNRTREQVRKTAREVEQSGMSIEQMFGRIKLAAAGALAGFSVKEFASKVVQVRGEFQQLEVAFNTMLGSAEKANTLMEQLTKTASITPFDLQGVTQGAKQLLAYGIEAEKVNETLVHLGDIAAGLSLPLNDLVYLYGTTMTQGRMFTQDLRQFMGRGIPLAEELAKQFGVTKDKVQELVSSGKVGAKEFNQAIMAMSSEGGKFAGLMEAQSKTITGQISNIEDAIDVMFNNIGKQSDGIINGTLSVVSSLVENYEKVGKVILSLVAIYGTYKTAVMTAIAIQSLQKAGVGALTAAETIHYGWLVLCEKAQALLNKTMLANPYVAAATAVAGLVAVMWNMKSAQDLVNDAEEEYNRKKQETIAKEEEHRHKIEELVSIAGDESLSTDARRAALVQLELKYPSIFKKYATEYEMLKHIRDIKAEIAILDGKTTLTKKSNELVQTNKRIKELKDKARSQYGGQEYFDTSQLTRKELAELQAAQKRRDQLTKEIRKESQENYLTNLTGISNKDLKKQINERNSLIAKMKATGAKYGKVQMGGVTGTFSLDELEGQNGVLEKELNRRKEIVKNSTENFKTESAKARQKAQKELKAWEALADPKKRSNSNLTIDGKKVSEMSSDEFYAEMEKRQKAYDEAKKKEEAYNKAANGGATPKKTKEKADHTSEQEAQRKQKLFELDQKNMERQAREKAALEDALADLAIASEQDATKRELLQREKDHQEKLNAIDKQAEEWKKANYEAAKAVWEANNKDKTKTFADTEEGAAGWQGQKLNATQQATYDAMVAIENKEWERQQREAEESLVASHQSYVDKKIAIDKEYQEEVKKIDDAIAKAEARGDKQSADALKRSKAEAAKQRNKQQADLTLEKLKESPEYIRAFEDLENTSTETLQIVIKNFEEAKEAAAKNLDPKDFKEYSDTLQQMYDELSSRDPFKAMRDSLAEVKEAHAKVKKATDEYNRVKKGEKIIIGETNKETGEFTTRLLTLEEAEKNAAEATDEENKAIATYKKASKSTQEKINDLAAAIQNVGNAMGGTAGEVVSLIGDIASFATGLMNAVTFTSKGATAAIRAVESASVILAVISAALQVIQKISGVVKGLFGSNDAEEYEKAKAQYENLADIWDELIEKKREYLNESWGKEVMAAADEAKRLLEIEKEQLKILAQQRLAVTNGSHSMEYRMWKGSYGFNGQNWQDVAGQISNILGVQFNSMADMLNMSAEQLQWIKENYIGLWANMDSDFKEYLEKIIEFGDTEVGILEDSLARLTGTTADDVFEDFLNSLYELADGSEDVMDDIAENWQKMVNRMVINNLIAGKMKEQLNSWYEELAQLQKERSGYTDENGNWIQISDAEYQQRLAALQQAYNDLVAQGQSQMEQFTEMGIIKPISEATDEAKTYFDSLRDSWLSTLTDMEGDGKQWKQEILRVMFEDLVESMILGDEFSEWLDNWKKAYKEAVESNDTQRMTELLDEQVQKREELAEQAKQIADSIGYTEAAEEAENAFSDIKSSLLDTLMDMDSDAEAWGKKIRETLLSEMIEKTIVEGMGLGELMENYGKQLLGFLTDETLSDEARRQSIDDVLKEMEDAFDEANGLAQKMREALGLGKDEDTPESPFKDLRTTFRNTLMGMESDAEDFRDQLNKILLQDLLDKQVFDIPLTVNGKDFENFDEYIEDWNTRYLEAVANNETATIEALVNELVEQQGILDEATQELRERLIRQQEDETFKDMASSWVSTLMDMNSTAEDLSKQIGQTMAQKIIEQMVVANMIQPLLDNLQEAFNTAMGAEGATWQTAVNDAGVQTAMQAITDAYPALQDTVKDIMERLGLDIKGEAKQGFSDLRGMFVSTLTDMEADAETLAKKLGQTMVQQMLDAYIDKKYEQQLAALNEQWAEALESGDPARIDAVAEAVEQLYATISNDDAVQSLADQLKELSKAAEESPLQGLRDQLRDFVSDAKNSVKDLAKDINQTLTDALIDKLIFGEAFDQKIEEYEKQLAKIMGDPELSEEERAKQMKKLGQLIAEESQGLQDQANAIREWFGSSEYGDQEATVNMADKATYDQFEMYLGIATAQQITGELQLDVQQQILYTLQAMSGITSPTGGMPEEQRNLMLIGNQYLLDIRNYEKEMLERFTMKLDSINQKLARL